MHEGSLEGHEVSSPKKEVDARAILCALKETNMQVFYKIHLSLDALKVIRAINSSIDWSIHSILLDIKESSFAFEEGFLCNLGSSFWLLVVL